MRKSEKKIVKKNIDSLHFEYEMMKKITQNIISNLKKKFSNEKSFRPTEYSFWERNMMKKITRNVVLILYIDVKKKTKQRLKKFTLNMSFKKLYRYKNEINSLKTSKFLHPSAALFYLTNFNSPLAPPYPSPLPSTNTRRV